MYAFVNSIVHKIADFVCWQGKYLNVKLWLSQGNFLKYETRLKHLLVGAENSQEALFNKHKGEGTCVGRWMIIIKKEILTSTLANANTTVRTILSWVIQVQKYQQGEDGEDRWPPRDDCRWITIVEKICFKSSECAIYPWLRSIDWAQFPGNVTSLNHIVGGSSFTWHRGFDDQDLHCPRQWCTQHWHEINDDNYFC